MPCLLKANNIRKLVKKNSLIGRRPEQTPVSNKIKQKGKGGAGEAVFLLEKTISYSREE
jgi:hypothetical protein